MAVYGGVRVDGLTAVVRALLEIGLEVDDLKEAMSNISKEGARLAASYAPVGTTYKYAGSGIGGSVSGQLRASIRGNRARSSAHVAAGDARRTPYAGPINYGWEAHNITGQGFMQKADQQWQPYSLRRLEQEINKQIAKRGLR